MIKSGSLLVACLSALGSLPALAEGAGEVVNLSGTLSVQRPDGSMRVLGQKSEVQPGDLLSTQKDSYAQINFTDGSSTTMRPNTQMKLEAYQFVKEKPEADNAFFRLLKGGMRTVTGLVGKRGNQDAYRIGTATATIGIRGSVGDTIACAPSCEGVVRGGETLEPGTHHQTHNGIYTMQIDNPAAAFNEIDRVFLAEAAQIGDSNVMIDEPPRGGRILLAQAPSGIIEIPEGYHAHSNGRQIRLLPGPLGGGVVNLYVPGSGGPGLKGGTCK
jgi:hypothetical protein